MRIRVESRDWNGDLIDAIEGEVLSWTTTAIKPDCDVTSYTYVQVPAVIMEVGGSVFVIALECIHGTTITTTILE